MNKNKSVILVLCTIWMLCLIGLIAPWFSGARISVPDGVWREVYHSPSEDKILLVGYREASLFNLKLNALGSYKTQSQNTHVRLFDISPVWSPNEEFVILQETEKVLYLDLNNLSIRYELSKSEDLKLDFEEYAMNQFFVDDLDRLHYVANESLIQYNPTTKVRTIYANLTYNDLNIFFVRFHSSGNYISIYNRINESNVELLLFNIANHSFTTLEDFNGRYDFAPTKPYIAMEKIGDTNERTIQVYNFESNFYYPEFNSDAFRFNNKLSWLKDSEQIMVLEPQENVPPVSKAYPDRITTYDVKSGE
ncbi:MAG: hypothetical protein IH840_17305, partial [Candidatus Heimdallarchaeota archaeon]|nr:hypothetical protein [Candidatus Heimdallarchaeota archaeon]